MKVWRVVVEVTDLGGDRETGERWRHLGRKQVERLFDKIDPPAGITVDVRLVEEN